MNLRFLVPGTQEALPLRSFLKRQGFSLHLWRRLKHQGRVTVNGETVIAALTSVGPGDEVICEMPEASPVEPLAMPLDIRYEDDWLLIVNKPPQQLVHPVSRKRPEPTLANAVTHYYETTGQPLIFHPLHRLDRNTSGLVLIAKQPHVQARLTSPRGALFHRRYLGITEGAPPTPEGLIDAPLARKEGSLIEQTVTPAGRPAQTRYRTLARAEGLTLLELSPLTGRTHQIRVHLAHLGLPLLGDDLYSQPSPLIARQALHAWRVELPHPATGEPLTVTAPPPEDMGQLLRRFAAAFDFETLS